MKKREKAVVIPFPSLPWVKVEMGGALGRVKRKVIGDGRSVRVLEVSPEWNEFDWCSKPHVGYVTSGRLHLEFLGAAPLDVGRGMGFWIPSGCPHKAGCKRTATVFIVD